MWRAIAQGIRTFRVRCIRDVAMYQQMWCELHSHDWFRHCWLCQYVGNRTCRKCPMYRRFGEDCRTVGYRSGKTNPCRMLRNDGNDYLDAQSFASYADEIADFLEGKHEQ